MRALSICFIIFAVAACDEPRRASDQALIEQVEAANVIPPEPIEPQELETDDLFRAGFETGGCRFLRGGSSESLLFVAKPGRGLMKVEGTTLTFAPDRGSDPLIQGVYSQYDGLRYSARMVVRNNANIRTDEGNPYYRGSLIVLDGKDQILFDVDGVYECEP